MIQTFCLLHESTCRQPVPLELIRSSRDAIRKAQEADMYSIGVKPFDAKGINRREEM